MDTNDYVLEISFRVEANNLGSYPTLGGAQSASIMATNRDAINELVNEMNEKGFRLIMIYSQPITDDNDSIRRDAFSNLKGYIRNRNVSEREVREFVKIKKKLNEYYQDTKELIMYTPNYQFTDDETKVYGTDEYNLANSFKPNSYFIFLSMFDSEYSLRNLNEKVKQELTEKLNNEPSKFELHKGILEKLRDKVKEDSTNNFNYIEGLVRNAERNERDVDAIEGSMRERLYNNTYDEQINGTDKIAPNPLLKNFVKFKYGSESGIYDEQKAEESKQKKVNINKAKELINNELLTFDIHSRDDMTQARDRINFDTLFKVGTDKIVEFLEINQVEAAKKEAKRVATEINNIKRAEDERQRAEEARRNQVLKIKINTNSNLYFKLPNLYKALMSSQIRDKVKINTPINDTITITGISQEEATEIIRNINSSSLGLNLKHGVSGVELTFANQPFEVN